MHTIDFPYKILTPQRPTHLVARERLHTFLETIADRRLITLTAPAGYGKTSLLTSFTHEAALPVCWYTLDSSDQNPWVFLEYLVAAIEKAFPGALKQTKAVLAGTGQTPFARVAEILARDIYMLEQDFVVVIDDWHLVDHVSEIGEIVSLILLRCARCHFVIASRSYPSLPNMMLLASRRQMHSLNEHLLRFTSEEVCAVFEAEYRTELPVQQAVEVTEQFNGWITGILLSFQASEWQAMPPEMVSFSPERQIYRYFAEQVLGQQSPEVQAFLLDSALLEELTLEQCTTLLERNDARKMLEILRRRHLFVNEIRPGVLRYHPTFREFLQDHYAESQPEQYHAMACRIADTYMRQGQWLIAFERYTAIQQYDAALNVIATGGDHLYRTGRLETLEHWFSTIPAQDLAPKLLYLKARVLIKRGRHAEAQTLAQIAETHMQPDDEPLVRLLQAQIARITGRYQQAMEIAQGVLSLTDDLAQRAMAIRTLAICHHRVGEIRTAIGYFKEALAIEHRRGDLYEMAHLQLDLGICHKELGILNLAEEYYDQADAYWEMIGNVGLRASSLNSRGTAKYLAGHFQEAHDVLTTALRYACEAAVPDYEAAVLSSLGALYNSLQLWGRAAAAYADARRAGGSAYIAYYLDLEHVRMQLRQRNYDEAARALRQLSETTLYSHVKTVLFLQGSVACQRGELDHAQSYLASLFEVVNLTEAPMDLARTYLLQAQIVAAAAPNDDDGFIAALQQAYGISKQLGHDTFLIIETMHLRGLLKRAVALGWSQADQWLQRHQDIALAAKTLEQEDQRPVLQVHTLGTDQIMFDGNLVNVGWQKAREVFYYLLTHFNGVPTDTLCEAIWPDLSEKRSRDALRSAIYELRSKLPRELIELQGRKVYKINRAIVQIEYDVDLFLGLLDAPTHDPEMLSEALDMYHGSYLTWTDNEWCVAWRSHLERRYQHALHLTATGFEQRQMYSNALTRYQHVLDLDLLDEAAHAGMMRCHLALGNRGAAINQYQSLRQVLDDELGLIPEQTSEVEHLYREILATS